MQGRKKRLDSRVRNLIGICALSVIVLIVSSYAWFIGMQSVHVSSFEIEIAATKALELSLDGKTWSNTVTINEAKLPEIDAQYPDNTNSWGGSGLKPISTVGKIDLDASRLILYEKASFSPVPGGFKILASRVNNHYNEEKTTLSPEQNGYVVFDLFIKNHSGNEYYKEVDYRNEEDIYLTIDSTVEVATAGGIADTGIENSIRVAFAQIGRVIGTTKAEDAADIIQGITCANTNEVSGICHTRDAVIWEPNDKAHNRNAVNFYETTCLLRDNQGTEPNDVSSPDSYTTSCPELVYEAEDPDNIPYYPTYSIADVIGAEDNVNAYDGEEYNGYTKSVISESNPNGKLMKFDYFTDTEKNYTGTDRPSFMRLAPNSITKVRIYVYIEGQDIDCYSWSQIGKRISVRFGFTKERLTEEDIEYGGPNTDEHDNTPPVITLNGSNLIELPLGTPYVEYGATAQDDYTQYIDPNDIEIEYPDGFDPENLSVGEYEITYKARDRKGNVGEATRIVRVYDPEEQE